MKSMDAEALRVQKLGFDDANNTYWYFYGTRLYKEEPLEEKKTWDEEWMEQKWNALTGSTEKRGRGRPPKTPKKQNVENNAGDDSKDDSIVIVRGRGRPRRTPRKENVEIIVEDEPKNDSFTTIVRGRGRPRKTPKKEDVENNVEDEAKDDRFMNVSEKSRWSVVCDTLEEWVNFTEKFKDSKSKNEKSLFTILQENFLPILNKIYEEKERKLQEKIKALLPEEPLREKIVTRRETRRMRGDTGGDINYALLNGYDSDEDYRHRNDDFKMTEVKSRAERLEERKKRAVEADVVQYVGTHKRVKHNEDTKDSSESSQNSTSVDNSDGNEIDLMSQMVKLLSSVKLHKDAWPFLYPVNEDDAPGYYEIIKDPVDLSAIESKLYKGDYETIGDLDEDFSKMVSNCELYNGENHAYSKMAQTLRKMFRKEVANLLEMLETVDSSNGDSEESIDSQYHSSSNSSSNSPPHEPPVVESKEHKKVKSKKKKRKHGNQEALDLLAQATDIAVQENVVNSPSPPQKRSPAPQEIRPATFYVPSTNMPSNVASSSSSSPSTNKTSVPATSSSFISANSSPQVVPKKKPVIVRANKSNIDNRIPVENVASTSLNTISNKTSNSTMQQTNVNQSPPKTLPIILSRSPPNQRTHNNPMPTVTMQSNVCMPNGLPVVQQVILPAGTQLPSTGQQYIFTSPQNTIRSVQLQNNAGQINQGYMKVVPQLITPASVMQMSKDGMQSFQFQTLSPNTTQAFTQVAQNPQFVNVPYVVSNQNSLTNSTSQPAVNYQPYQMPPRQMHIGGQGNG